MSFDPRSLALYPDQPGVYLMKDAAERVLYVGKAKNLRARLKQYFAIHGDQREMVPYLTAQVETIDTIIALTEKDALLLENTVDPSAFEIGLVLKILHELGYVDPKDPFDGFLSNSEFSFETIYHFAPFAHRAVAIVNASLRESQL